MGQSTDALLWYGITADEGGDLHDKLDMVANGPDDAEGYFAGDGSEWFTEHGFLGQVTIVGHCSCDYTMYGLAVVGVFPDAYDKAVLRAYRGSPKTFTALPDYYHAWDEVIRDVLVALGVEDVAPSWCLASNWC